MEVTCDACHAEFEPQLNVWRRAGYGERASFKCECGKRYPVYRLTETGVAAREHLNVARERYQEQPNLATALAFKRAEVAFQREYTKR